MSHPESVVPEEVGMFNSLPTGCFDCDKHPHGYCEVYKGQEHRQHTRIGGCAMKPRKEIKEVGFKLNPLKASKRGLS